MPFVVDVIYVVAGPLAQSVIIHEVFPPLPPQSMQEFKFKASMLIFIQHCQEHLCLKKLSLKSSRCNEYALFDLFCSGIFNKEFMRTTDFLHACLSSTFGRCVNLALMYIPGLTILTRCLHSGVIYDILLQYQMEIVSPRCLILSSRTPLFFWGKAGQHITTHLGMHFD